MPDANRDLPLAGRGIVITRPAAQAVALARLVDSLGGRPILFPVIEIVDVPDRTRVDALIDRLETFDIAIFVSPNAATRAMQAIRARRELPPQVSIIALGSGTARELEREGVRAVVAPISRSDSEAVLDLPLLREVRGKRVAIFRGVGGRELLREELTERGATVEYAECYQRVRPNADAAPLVAALRDGGAEAVVCTSSEGVQNLHEMLGAEGQVILARTVMFVTHPRIAAHAARLGIERVIVTERGDEGIARTLEAHFTVVA